MTIGEVTEEVLREGGDLLSEGMAELTKMPHHQQRAFASEYRALADSFKEKLKEIIEKKGPNYVVEAEDIHRMVQGIKSAAK